MKIHVSIYNNNNIKVSGDKLPIDTSELYKN